MGAACLPSLDTGHRVADTSPPRPPRALTGCPASVCPAPAQLPPTPPGSAQSPGASPARRVCVRGMHGSRVLEFLVRSIRFFWGGGKPLHFAKSACLPGNRKDRDVRLPTLELCGRGRAGPAPGDGREGEAARGAFGEGKTTHAEFIDIINTVAGTSAPVGRTHTSDCPLQADRP